ncbi:Transcriptional regulator, AbiEi antitoxin, Type IV TA system [Friedmanniella luteola]|uniref:Transcriptional regulator, AbiEi antitoxin, Type IV TA system n=1 Tax=Friedmanniella luteola TaxID=546871 RepID=A0A1H1Q740_9ACTN|nr:hypothetical protein [Friedmanniella luteola]SDS19220.1 Transcriptional regulator, AbiEi antitoxin, Type IV TA system [Friedmanniella luteola]
MPRTTADLLAEGYSHNELAQSARRGELVRLRRGSYLDPDEVSEDAALRHRQLVGATLPLPGAGVVSHLSAAVVHGLPVWGDPLRLVHVTRTSGTGRREGHLHLHVTPLGPADVVQVDDLAVTALARTVVDLARSLPLQQSVAAGDAALRKGLTSGELATALDEAQGRPGVFAARRAVRLMDARSESAGESASRVVLHQCGLPPTDLQHQVFDDRGRLVGRSDFAWPEHRTLGEFDGRVKYGRLLRPGQTPEDVVWEEKRREDALRDRGWQVVRWIWADLLRPDLLVERLGRAFRRNAR